MSKKGGDHEYCEHLRCQQLKYLTPFPPKPTTVTNIVAPILTLPPSDYRVDRYFLSETLSDSTGESEKVCWREKALPKEIDFHDLEYSKGHYLVIGCKKSSSDKTVASAFHLVSKDYKNIARTHHPDKTSDTAMHSVFENPRTHTRSRIRHLVFLAPWTHMKELLILIA